MSAVVFLDFGIAVVVEVFGTVVVVAVFDSGVGLSLVILLVVFGLVV